MRRRKQKTRKTKSKSIIKKHKEKNFKSMYFLIQNFKFYFHLFPPIKQNIEN